MDKRSAHASGQATIDRVLRGRWLLLLVFVSAVACSVVAGCQSSESSPLVGHWSDYDGLFRIEFTASGHCVFDIQDRPEYYPHLIYGTYEITDDDVLVIHIDHELSGQFRYAVSADALQLTDDTGRRRTYRRMKMSSE